MKNEAPCRKWFLEKKFKKFEQNLIFSLEHSKFRKKSESLLANILLLDELTWLPNYDVQKFLISFCHVLFTKTCLILLKNYVNQPVK